MVDPQPGSGTNVSGAGKEKTAKDAGDGSGVGSKDEKSKGTGKTDEVTGGRPGSGNSGSGGAQSGKGPGFQFGVTRGGRPDGVLGGTPYSPGRKPSEQDDSRKPSPSAPGGQPSSHGSDAPSNSRPGLGDQRPVQGPEVAPGAPSPRGSRPTHGEGPGGAKQDAEGRHHPYGWKNVLLDMAGMMNFEPGNDGPGGREDGLPGGRGDGGGGLLQWLYIGASFVSFIDMITGAGELAKALVSLPKNLVRLGRRLLTEVPTLLRNGARGIARALGLVARESYLASRVYSSGFSHTREAIMAAFRSAKPTAASRAILEALDSGALRVEFKALEKGGTTASATEIVVNNTMHMEDVLDTLVHEGSTRSTLERDHRPPGLNLPGYSLVSELAHAELRAFSSAIEFAQANQFAISGMKKFYNRNPMSLLVDIAVGYDFALSRAETIDTLNRFLRGKP